MDPVEQLKQTCDQIARRFEEFKKENDNAIKKGVSDALAEANLANLSQAIDDLTGKREDLEKRVKADAEARVALERAVNELKLKGTPDNADEAKSIIVYHETMKALSHKRGLPIPAALSPEEYRGLSAVQRKWLRQGKDALNAEETKALQAGLDTDGGFYVNPDLTGRIVSKTFDLSPIRQIASVLSIASDALEGIEDITEADAAWVGEVATRTDTNTPTIGKYRIETFEMYASPKATQRLLDDSSIDIEAWLAGKVADKFARLEGAAFCVGTGGNKPRGFASYTTAATADATRAWGQLEHVVTGANGAYHTTGADPLFTLLGAFKPRYLPNARWVTRREVIAATRKLKGSDNNYLWQPGLQAGQPDRLLGYPIVLAEDLPALSTNGLSMAFGDFREGYQIVDRLGVRTIRDNLTDKPYVKFYTIKRTGGQVVNFEAIKFIKFST